MNSIEITKLSFRYKKQWVLTDLDLTVPQGSIYGYLGKNGAGKSTTLKLILGLLNVPAGKIAVFGKRIEQDRLAILNKIGSFIESPSLYEELTCYENLKYLSIIFQAPHARIDYLLDLVGLCKEKNKKVKHFSSGMKQRLAIAVALFHDPELLLLDEPINGLDPGGVYEVRELLFRLQSEGKTIFLSSHILSEVEKLCTHIGILDKGTMLYQGTAADLLLNTKRTIKIRLNDLPMGERLCRQQGITLLPEQGPFLRVSIENDLNCSLLLKMLVENGLEIYDMNSETQSLESIFVNLTNR